MTTEIDRDAMEAAALAATPGEWSYRSQEYDDWGIVRAPGGIVANARQGDGRPDYDEHRRLGTDPYGPNAAHIVAAQPRNVLALIERLRAAEAECTAMEARAIAAGQARDEAVEVLVVLNAKLDAFWNAPDRGPVWNIRGSVIQDLSDAQKASAEIVAKHKEPGNG